MTAKSRVREYTAPRLYEIAFDMNRKGEVDFLVHCFGRFARRPVRTVLDIACGTGPHLIRLADRGYRMSGLDLSRKNIEFLRERLAARGHTGELVVGDMTDFRLARPVDDPAHARGVQREKLHGILHEHRAAHVQRPVAPHQLESHHHVPRAAGAQQRHDRPVRSECQRDGANGRLQRAEPCVGHGVQRYVPHHRVLAVPAQDHSSRAGIARVRGLHAGRHRAHGD